MATDMEQQMRNTMDKAIAEQLVPGWDREGSWDGLKHRIQPNAAPGTYRWRSAAAAAIMLLVVSVAWWWGNPQHPAAPVAEQPPVNQPLPTVQPIASEPDTQRPATTTNTLATLIRTATPAATCSTPVCGEPITNATDCPIEIRISQMMKCPDTKPAAISTRSTMEPGETAELAYQQRDSIAPNCSLTVHEIAITSIATGETIVLNEHSAPSTAQEVFGIITGQIRGDVLAGMFHTDCNKHRAGKAVSLANREGGLVLQ